MHSNSNVVDLLLVLLLLLHLHCHSTEELMFGMQFLGLEMFTEIMFSKMLYYW